MSSLSLLSTLEVYFAKITISILHISKTPRENSKIQFDNSNTVSAEKPSTYALSHIIGVEGHFDKDRDCNTD
jgi:hypothetical protein